MKILAKALGLTLILTTASCAQVVSRGLQLEDATVGDALQAIEMTHGFRHVDRVEIHSIKSAMLDACNSEANAVNVSKGWAESKPIYEECLKLAEDNFTELYVATMARELKALYGELTADQLIKAGMEPRLAGMVAGATVE